MEAVLHSGPVLYTAATLLLMPAVIALRRNWRLHAALMGLVILGDLAMPFYLYATRDWYRRLIEQGELFGFLIWMHVALVFVLYGLYYQQVRTGRRLAATGEAEQRAAHRAQARAILGTRLLVLLTGALLVEPAEDPVAE